MSNRAERVALINQIRELPTKLRESVGGLTDAQLDRGSDADPWTIRQIVHHVADSHLNMFVRTKLALTEERPTLKPYDQDAWATLPDATQPPIQASLAILDGLHARWVVLLKGINEADWQRSALHPENGELTVYDLLVTGVEHGAAHLEQIGRIKEAEGWN